MAEEEQFEAWFNSMAIEPWWTEKRLALQAWLARAARSPAAPPVKESPTLPGGVPIDLSSCEVEFLAWAHSVPLEWEDGLPKADWDLLDSFEYAGWQACWQATHVQPNSTPTPTPKESTHMNAQIVEDFRTWAYDKPGSSDHQIYNFGEQAWMAAASRYSEQSQANLGVIPVVLLPDYETISAEARRQYGNVPPGSIVSGFTLGAQWMRDLLFPPQVSPDEAAYQKWLEEDPNRKYLDVEEAFLAGRASK